MPSHSLRRLPFLGRGLFEGLFELTRRSSRALNSPCALHPELQRYKDTVRCAELGAEVPGHCQKKLTQTLIVRLLKTHFYTPNLEFQQKNCVSDQTCLFPALEKRPTSLPVKPASTSSRPVTARWMPPGQNTTPQQANGTGEKSAPPPATR